MKDEDDESIVIHLDPVFTPLGNDNHKYSKEVRDLLIKKYGKELNTLNFEEKYYDVIINYLKDKNKTGYIEGGSIAEIQNVSNLVGTVVVKRTGVLKCLFRTINRDYHNDYFMKKEIELHGKFGKITRFFKVIKRRKKILKSYHAIEEFIDKLENYK